MLSSHCLHPTAGSKDNHSGEDWQREVRSEILDFKNKQSEYVFYKLIVESDLFYSYIFCVDRGVF